MGAWTARAQWVIPGTRRRESRTDSLIFRIWSGNYHPFEGRPPRRKKDRSGSMRDQAGPGYDMSSGPLGPGEGGSRRSHSLRTIERP